MKPLFNKQAASKRISKSNLAWKHKEGFSNTQDSRSQNTAEHTVPNNMFGFWADLHLDGHV